MIETIILIAWIVSVGYVVADIAISGTSLPFTPRDVLDRLSERQSRSRHAELMDKNFPPTKPRSRDFHDVREHKKEVWKYFDDMWEQQFEEAVEADKVREVLTSKIAERSKLTRERDREIIAFDSSHSYTATRDSTEAKVALVEATYPYTVMGIRNEYDPYVKRIEAEIMQLQQGYNMLMRKPPHAEPPKYQYERL